MGFHALANLVASSSNSNKIIASSEVLVGYRAETTGDFE